MYSTSKLSPSSVAPTYRAFQKTADDLLDNEARISLLALLTGLRLQCFTPFSLSLTLINSGFFSKYCDYRFCTVSLIQPRLLACSIMWLTSFPCFLERLDVIQSMLKDTAVALWVRLSCNTLLKFSISPIVSTKVPFCVSWFAFPSRIFVVNCERIGEERHWTLTGPGSLKSKRYLMTDLSWLSRSRSPGAPAFIHGC